jgi:hypothetical protein
MTAGFEVRLRQKGCHSVHRKLAASGRGLKDVQSVIQLQARDGGMLAAACVR